MQVRELETKAVALETQNVSLNEELRNYKVYMKDTITQYKRQISSLTTQLAQLRDGTAGGAGTGSGAGATKAIESAAATSVEPVKFPHITPS